MDRSEGALRFKIAMWSMPGVVLGLVAGLVAGRPGLAVALAALCGVGVFVSVSLAVGVSGAAAGTLHNPSGRTTPRVQEHSAAESLVARGRFEEAVAAFEQAVAEDPRDPQPYMWLARIHRDHLQQYDDAARWFARACRDARMDVGLEVLARRELAEMHLHRSGQPARAAPVLARLAEQRPGTPEGEWAAAELAALKERIRRSDRTMDGGEADEPGSGGRPA